MTEPSVKLPRSADELLRDLPLAEPDFEVQARAIEERLQRPLPTAALSDEELLGAPRLDADPGEPAIASQVRAAPKSNFAEMARRSLGKPKDDVADLAKELLAATAQRRRPDAQMVARVRAAGQSATATPVPLSEPRRDRHSGVVPRTEGSSALASTAPGRAESDKRGLVIALTGVALAAAAAVALFVKSPPAAPVEGSATRPAVVAAAEPVPAARRAPVAPGEPPLTPDALPSVATAKSSSPPEAVRTSSKAAAPSKARLAPVTPTSPTALPAPGGLTEDALPLATREPAKGVESAPEPALRPAQGHSDDVPLNPSSGAVSTALASVRSGAQACLAGQTEPVRVSVTFASDGHVLRVTAGGPSGACLQGALSQARISPFAKDSFTATTTVRPP